MRIRVALLPVIALAMPAIAAAPDHPADHPGRFCINDTTVGNPTPLPDGRLLFRGEPSRNQSYAATFKGGGCRGMHELSTVIVERFSGGQYCEGDRVRAIDPPQVIPGPVCVIDHFDRYQEPPRKGR